jgi:hypothetical protein
MSPIPKRQPARKGVIKIVYFLLSMPTSMIVASNIDKTPLIYRRSNINFPNRKFIHSLNT